jgi:hypothetical protein
MGVRAMRSEGADGQQGQVSATVDKDLLIKKLTGRHEHLIGQRDELAKALKETDAWGDVAAAHERFVRADAKITELNEVFWIINNL